MRSMRRRACQVAVDAAERIKSTRAGYLEELFDAACWYNSVTLESSALERSTTGGGDRRVTRSGTAGEVRRWRTMGVEVLRALRVHVETGMRAAGVPSHFNTTAASKAAQRGPVRVVPKSSLALNRGLRPTFSASKGLGFVTSLPESNAFMTGGQDAVLC
jgi:hypothetical protein